MITWIVLLIAIFFYFNFSRGFDGFGYYYFRKKAICMH